MIETLFPEFDDTGDASVQVVRSKLDRTVWVPLPLGLSVDQTYALHPGGLRAVQEWAAAEWADVGPDQEVRWKRLDSDRWEMQVVTLTRKPGR